MLLAPPGLAWPVSAEAMLKGDGGEKLIFVPGVAGELDQALDLGLAGKPKTGLDLFGGVVVGQELTDVQADGPASDQAGAKGGSGLAAIGKGGLAPQARTTQGSLVMSVQNHDVSLS